ncbi:MAG: inositol monophosphatase family protein [Verrucomicrobiota bacterium]|jgi:myo-inositol-1(or 4)-monophosphatase|nr:inositol monophosphatase family protein [Verrucomicrobiota bacterium]MDP6752184.1 inositol monophosphatase family protein [Verrucomicrobiota bacterium]
MTVKEKKQLLATAVKAAHAAGDIMRRNLMAVKKINEATQRDIKLELDVRCQRRIESMLTRAHPEIAILGEEENAGDIESDLRWVVDPIDGTVNFTYGIPHACVSIALQQRLAKRNRYSEDYETIIGAVLDPFTDELWTAIRGQTAKLNGKKIRVNNGGLREALLSIGFAKDAKTLEYMMPYFTKLVPKIRKPRIMGSATLALTYVACGRFHGYIESKVRLWDIAAGGLIVECAGGEFWRLPRKKGEHSFAIIASNGKIRKQVERLCGPLDPDGVLG